MKRGRREITRGVDCRIEDVIGPVNAHCASGTLLVTAEQGVIYGLNWQQSEQPPSGGAMGVR